MGSVGRSTSVDRSTAGTQTVKISSSSEVNPIWTTLVEGHIIDKFKLSGYDVSKTTITPIERASDYSTIVYRVALPSGSVRLFVIEPFNSNYIYELMG